MTNHLSKGVCISKFLEKNLLRAGAPKSSWTRTRNEVQHVVDGPVDHANPAFSNKHKFLYGANKPSVGFRLTRPALGGQFIRHAHTDIKFPGFQDLRLERPGSRDEPESYKHQPFLYASFAMAGVGATVIADNCIRGLMDYLLPDAQTLASRVLEVSHSIL